MKMENLFSISFFSFFVSNYNFKKINKSLSFLFKTFFIQKKLFYLAETFKKKQAQYFKAISRKKNNNFFIFLILEIEREKKEKRNKLNSVFTIFVSHNKNQIRIKSTFRYYF